MRGSVKGLQRIARQKAPVIKENAKYSFVDLGKVQYQFVHSPNFKKVLAGAPPCGAMHDNATSAVDRSLNPFCCSHSLLIPPFPLSSTAACRLRFYTITEKGEASAGPCCGTMRLLSLAGTYCTIKAGVCHKNSIHCFKPFPTAWILHGISTVVRFNNFRRLTLFAVQPKPMPLKRLKLVLKSR